MTELELKRLAWSLLESGQYSHDERVLIFARNVLLFFDFEFFLKPRSKQIRSLNYYSGHPDGEVDRKPRSIFKRGNP